MIQRATLIKLLKEKGLYEKHFSPTIDKLYELESLIKTCKKSIEDEGLNIVSTRGSRKNPAVDLIPSLYKEFRYTCSLLKLNPKDADLKPDDDDDTFKKI
ncbi:P27 family phage terminase small subunit [Carboxylicivirga sp. RSCT41]|uniref:P27 family phage terminase small subunit n=1 Tax=Carboxylicivirga agarovorans TaxID=3417570 RepID=UPI003D359ACF